jgi:hypothetical protein
LEVSVKTIPQPDPLCDAFKQFIREQRIRGIQNHDKSIRLVTDKETAAVLTRLGLTSKPIGPATRKALSDVPLALGDQHPD